MRCEMRTESNNFQVEFTKDTGASQYTTQDAHFVPLTSSGIPSMQEV